MSRPGLQGRSPFIEDQEVLFLQVLHQFLDRALFAGLGQLQDQLGHGEEFRLQAHLAGFHANGNGQMRFVSTDWAIEDEVLVLPDELAALQLFPAKQRRELDMVILVAFKGLVGRESGPLHEAVPLVLLSGCKLCLEDMDQEFFLLRRCLILAEVRDTAAEEELACGFADLFIQRGLHLRRRAGRLLSGMLGHRWQEKALLWAWYPVRNRQSALPRRRRHRMRGARRGCCAPWPSTRSLSRNGS